MGFNLSQSEGALQHAAAQTVKKWARTATFMGI